MFICVAIAASALGPVTIGAASPPAVIDHIGLHVADPIVSARFYEHVLGLQPLVQKASPTARWVGSAAFQLHLIGGRTKPVDTLTETHFAFRVVNLQHEL